MNINRNTVNFDLYTSIGKI